MPFDRDGFVEDESKGSLTHEFRPDDNIIRILPPTMRYFTDSIRHFDYTVWTHFNIGPEGSPPIVCLRNGNKAASCPICAEAKAKRSNPETKEIGDRIVARPRSFMNMIDVQYPQKGVEILECGPKIREAIKKAAMDRSYGDIMDLVKGRNFNVNLIPGNRHPSGYNQYATTPEGGPSSVKEILPTGWKEKVDELEKFVSGKKPPTYEEAAAMLHQALGTPMPAQAQPPTPMSSRPAPAPQSAPQQPVPVPQPQQAAPAPQPAPQSAPQPQQAAPAAAPAATATAAPSSVELAKAAGIVCTKQRDQYDYEPSSALCSNECAHRDPCLKIYLGEAS